MSNLGLDGGRTLMNEGQLSATGGTLDLNAGNDIGAAQFINAAGATLTLNNTTSIMASNRGSLDDGVDASFSNAGTLTTSGPGSWVLIGGSWQWMSHGTSTIATAFHNSGLVDVQSGTLNLSGGSDATGHFQIASGATLQLDGGTHRFNGATTDGQGTLGLSNGALDLMSGARTINGQYNQTGGLLTGTGVLTLNGSASLTGGIQSGSGTTRLRGNSSVSNLGLDGGRTLLNEGQLSASGGTLDLNVGNDIGTGQIINAAGATFALTNATSILASNRGGLDDGTGANFSNAGTLTASGPGTWVWDWWSGWRWQPVTSTIATAFHNSGTVDVQSGTLAFTGRVAQHVDTTLTGGTWQVRNGATLSFDGPTARNITVNQAEVILDGPNSNFSRIDTLERNEGVLRLRGGRGFHVQGAFENTGVLELGGGTFNASLLSNGDSGEIFGSGVVNGTIRNAGLVRASGGGLWANGGIDGQSGIIAIDPGATLVLGANSDADILSNDGHLSLGSGVDVSVRVDYLNPHFGSGNAFSGRAQVSGGGRILADGDTAQVLLGDVTGGDTANATLAFGNVRVGEVVSRSFSIANTGTSGPVLRGALKTQGDGASLSDWRLSGRGTVATNYTPLASGESTGAFDLTFTAHQAGALVGQSLAIVNNFDNVTDQVLGITGAAYRLAHPVHAGPQSLDLGAWRVGDLATRRGVAIWNAAPADGFSEALDVRVAAVPEHFAAFGGIEDLAAGSGSFSGIEVAVETSTAGRFSGSLGLGLASDGSGMSGLGITDLGTTAVELSSRVYATAVADLLTPVIDFGIVHVGAPSLWRNVGIRNATTGALTDRLVGSLSTWDTGFWAGGSLGHEGLAASTTDSSSLWVGLDTRSAGLFSGMAHLALASRNPEMQDLGLAAGPVTLRAQVNAHANPVLQMSGGDGALGFDGTVLHYDFGTFETGTALQPFELNLTNLVTGPADNLRGDFTVGDGAFSLDGWEDFSDLSAGSSRVLRASLATWFPGSFEQVAFLDLFGTNASGYDGFIKRVTFNLRANIYGDPVPLPGAFWLAGSAMALLAGFARRRG